LRPALLALITLTGCNRYILFNQAGYEQASFSNVADVLFIVDNSASMLEETSDLGLNFNTFIDTLTSAQGAAPVTETLTDAVGNYVVYTQERGRFLDYQLGITTTSVDFSGQTPDAVDPGEAGLLIAPPLQKGDDGLADAFRYDLLCQAGYWNAGQVPDDPAYTCDQGTPSVISKQYLDCVCGVGAWEDNPQGSGAEEPIEAALMALCRSVDDPPEACFEATSPFAGSEAQKNEGFFRAEGSVVVVIVTDEGDNSRRMPQGEQDPAEYLEAFASFPKPVKFAVIGPAMDPETKALTCPSTAIPTWSVDRLQTVASATGGFYRPIVEEAASDASCVPTRFSDHLADLGDLLANLVTAFQLQSIPDVTTIRVWVDGEEVGASLVTTDEESGTTTTGDGWTYDSAQNAIVFWGAAIPGYNADVDIFYRPLDGKPRELPF
jgi:hypothetical protein